MMPHGVETGLNAAGPVRRTYAGVMSRFRARPTASSPTGGASTYSSRVLARLMDDLVRVPGTNIGLGLDALLGLVPGVGDAAGSVIPGVLLVDAVRNRVPLSVLALMGWNLVFDAILGLIPAVGDLADVAHRANAKNLRLLERTLAQGRTVDASSKTYVLRAALMVVVILGVVIGFAVLAIWGLLKLFRVV